MKNYEYVTIEIEQDANSGNPRDEFDNLSTFYGPRNSRYITGGKLDIETESYALPRLMNEYKKMGAVIVPFTSDAGDCFAVIERDEIIREYGNDSRSSLYHARQAAKGEISEFLAWCNGEVYGYTIKDNETGETLDSCWGFYGREYCEQEAQAQADYYEKKLSDHQKQIDSRVMWACREG